MTPKKLKPVLRLSLVLTRSIRENLLLTSFGFLSQCKHQPTCGEYLVQKIEKKGWLLGGLMGIKRIATCF